MQYLFENLYEKSPISWSNLQISAIVSTFQEQYQ